MFTDFNWIARWNFLLVSWFSKLLLSVLGVYPLIGSFRKILLLQFWLLGLDSVYRKALYGINFVDYGGHERWECTLPRLISLSQRKGTIIVMTSSRAQLEKWNPRVSSRRAMRGCERCARGSLDRGDPHHISRARSFTDLSHVRFVRRL